MKINGEYPKFYMRVEGKRYAAVSVDTGLCFTDDIEVECSFLWKNITCGHLSCIKNEVIYIEVPEEVK